MNTKATSGSTDLSVDACPSESIADAPSPSIEPSKQYEIAAAQMRQFIEYTLKLHGHVLAFGATVIVALGLVLRFGSPLAAACASLFVAAITWIVFYYKSHHRDLSLGMLKQLSELEQKWGGESVHGRLSVIRQTSLRVNDQKKSSLRQWLVYYGAETAISALCLSVAAYSLLVAEQTPTAIDEIEGRLKALELKLEMLSE